MRLTNLVVKSAKPKKKDYKIYDEGGLFLLVRKNGSKLWRYKYRFSDKERLLSIGAYPTVALKDARVKRDEARRLLDEGKDPSIEKQVQKRLNISAYGNNFEVIGREWHENKLAGRSDTHRKNCMRILDKDLIPYLGQLPVTGITTAFLLTVLRRIENRGAVDTAHRAKRLCGQIFRYAIQTGRAVNDPSDSLKGALKPTKIKHMAAITTPGKTGQLMLAIDAYDGTPVVKAALKISALFFMRPGEIRTLEWTFVNWDRDRIEIPDATMKKQSEDHIVPLSHQAKEILKQLYPITGDGKYIFPSLRGKGQTMSEATVRVALRTMGFDKETMCPHGFRAMARTQLDEELEYRIEWIEQQTAHAVKDPNGRAYNRTKHLKQRTEMMQRWADYLDEVKQIAAGENVVTANFRSGTVL